MTLAVQESRIPNNTRAVFLVWVSPLTLNNWRTAVFILEGFAGCARGETYQNDPKDLILGNGGLGQWFCRLVSGGVYDYQVLGPSG